MTPLLAILVPSFRPDGCRRLLDSLQPLFVNRVAYIAIGIDRGDDRYTGKDFDFANIFELPDPRSMREYPAHVCRPFSCNDALNYLAGKAKDATHFLTTNDDMEFVSGDLSSCLAVPQGYYGHVQTEGKSYLYSDFPVLTRARIEHTGSLWYRDMAGWGADVRMWMEHAKRGVLWPTGLVVRHHQDKHEAIRHQQIANSGTFPH